MRAEAGPLRVLFADDTLLVLDKPAGLLAVPGRGPDKQDCLSARAQAMYPDALVVHRLDMATSGLMLMARGAAAQRLLSQAFAERNVSKRYLARVQGHLPHPPDAWFDIALPLAIDWPNRPRRVVRSEGGKPCLTHCKVLVHEAAGTTRVELQPVTGRSHQLRVHMQAIGHPIVGDGLYDPEHADAPPGRLMLHAQRLGLAHPATGQALDFYCAADF